MRTASKQSSYQILKRKWTKRQKTLEKQLVKNHAHLVDWVHKQPRQVALSYLGGLMLLVNSSLPSLPNLNLPIADVSFAQTLDKSVFLITDLEKILPKDVRPLTSEEEEQSAEILSRTFGIKVSAELGGKRLNRSYGLIGAEQHLMRYPGDNMYSHFDSQDESREFWSSGMAPGRGAWGYFTHSQTEMTELDKQREKWYIAVQTFLIPDYNLRFSEYRDFFKYRKMLVVNPYNGRALVVVVGDVGPAQWTGKHLGGSPEVMRYLERKDGSARGPVLYFFIDDPEDKIQLGPILAK